MTTDRSSREVLTRWQRPVVALLIAGFVLLAGGGLFLLRSGGASQAAGFAVFAHVAIGVLLLPLLLVFVVPHARAHMRRKPVIGFTGALVLLVALAVVLTGVSLALQRSASRGAWVWGLHVFGGFGIVLIYALHRRWGANPASWRRISMGTAAILAVGVGLEAWERTDRPPSTILERATIAAQLTRAEYLPSLAANGAGHNLPDSRPIDDVANCATCHRKIVEDWRRSAHRHASMTNPYYRGTIEVMRERYPLVDTKWCASCHDPALLFTGKMAEEDIDLFSHDARVGLSCVSCHAVETRSVLGNGDYVLRSRQVYSWEKSDDPKVVAAHDILLKMKPDAHAKSMRPDNISQGEFCSTCHKAEIPAELNRWKWFRAQDEYDNWHDSGVSMNNARSFYHPAEAKRCHDCHMPLVADGEDPSANEEGLVRSHLFAAANTGLPYLRDDRDMIERQRAFLRQAARIDITAIVLPPAEEGGERRTFAPAWRALPSVKPGEEVEAHVVVRNLLTGHTFPGGTVDSNEVWVEFQASLGDQEPFYVSGAIDDETSLVDPNAEFYRSYVHDRHGNRVVNRIGPDIYTRIYVNVIGPGTADIVRYRFRVPETGEGPLRLRARLRYRKFMREYLDLLFPESKTIEHKLDDGTVRSVDLDARGTMTLPGGDVIEVHSLPIIDMSENELALRVDAQGTTTEPAAASTVSKAEDLHRLNDLGIAYLLQEDLAPAAAVFEEVTRLDPAYADGWVNLGRALVAMAEFDRALRELNAALNLKPGFPKARFFQGEVYRRRTQFALAEQAYEDVLKGFPLDRLSMLRLGEMLYEQGRYAGALGHLQRLLQIDPENTMAWFWSLQCYKDLGDADRAAAADAAYDKYRPDDDEPQRAGAVHLEHPHLLRMHQPIHVHIQDGTDRDP